MIIKLDMENAFGWVNEVFLLKFIKENKCIENSISRIYTFIGSSWVDPLIGSPWVDPLINGRLAKFFLESRDLKWQCYHPHFGHL